MVDGRDGKRERRTIFPDQRLGALTPTAARPAHKLARLRVP